MKNQLARELEKMLDDYFSGAMAAVFKQRIQAGKLTRDENPQSHFCVYFAAYDHQARQLFIGQHKKSGLWLFNGGHVDEGEFLSEAVRREINEEWGIDSNDLAIKIPALFTMTEINNLAKQPCRLHFDVWYFIDARKHSFHPDRSRLAAEFHDIYWMDLERARQLITDKSTIAALDFIEINYFSK